MNDLEIVLRKLARLLQSAGEDGEPGAERLAGAGQEHPPAPPRRSDPDRSPRPTGRPKPGAAAG